MRKQREAEAARAVASATRPEFLDVPSLVLNRSHPLSDLYYKKARYKVYWGGRGSAKSWGIAEALIRLTSALPLRVLCVREFQNSIKDSSHRILSDTIARLGMSSWFVATENSIRSRSGAEFLFKGMSDHRAENSVRSTEGVDICWVEEAQTMSAGSWRSLTPTVRKPGSEIWVSYNLISEMDATHARFVNEDGTPKRPNSIVHKINYDSNPYFGGELMEEMLFDKENDYDLYLHIWEGMPLRKSDAIIFNGKYRVEAFDDALAERADRLFYGLDHGFGSDPTVLTRSFILDDTLYVSHAQYGWRVDLDDLPELYDRVPGSRDWPIHADNSRPETISHLNRRGFIVHPAEKWEGCVEDGITHLRRFKQIVIHTRCKSGQAARPGLAEEAYLYRYKVDKNQVNEQGQPLVLPVVVDKHNHGWDAIRYSLDGYIIRSGALGMWDRLGRAQ